MDKKEKTDASENSDIGLSLIETIASPDLADLAQDFGEIALDGILKDGLLKDLPVFSSIVGVAKVAISIRDKLLVRKLLHFLHELGDTTEEERRKFLQQFANDPKEQRKVGENLILLLDRLDNLDKPTMVAKLFKAYLKGDIRDYDEFVYYSSVVDRAPISDLSALLLNFSGSGVGEEWLGRKFYHLGLSFMTVTVNTKFRPEPEDVMERMRYKADQQRSPTNKAIVKYKLSQSTYTFAKILLGDQYSGKEFYSDPSDWQMQ